MEEVVEELRLSGRAVWGFDDGVDKRTKLELLLRRHAGYGKWRGGIGYEERVFVLTDDGEEGMESSGGGRGILDVSLEAEEYKTARRKRKRQRAFWK